VAKLERVGRRRPAPPAGYRLHRIAEREQAARDRGARGVDVQRLLFLVPADDLLILDDFAIDVPDPVESRDLYDLLLERYRAGSIVVTSNRGPDEWLATFADPVRAQSAIDRFTSNAYDLIIEGESYRPRLKPRFSKDPQERTR